LCSVRAVPMNREDVKTVGGAAHRPMAYFNDGHGIFYNADQPGPHLVKDALEPFAHDGWDICCFGTIGADLVNYPSRVGTVPGVAGWQFIRPGDRNLAMTLKTMLEAGEDPLKQAVDQAHAQGQEFWFYLRPQGWAMDPGLDHHFRSDFYSRHPEWRCVESDGTPLSKLSIAFPEVREQLNTIIAEGIERGADAVCLTFVRGYPLVRYERPVLERYRSVYGRDARQVPDSDAGLQEIWRETVTGWLKEIRTLLDRTTPHSVRGRRKLAVMTGGNADWGKRLGIDLKNLAMQGLLDAVFFSQRGILDDVRRVEAIGEDPMDVKSYVAALEGADTKIYPCLYTAGEQKKLTFAELFRRAYEYYRQGATGLACWDTPAWYSRLHLDSPEVMALWIERYLPPKDNRFTEVAGLTVDRFPPMIFG
ncbi:MAG: hypothetical protein JXN60_03625, partial [Lentisphaerae bacterium]|nr:hypothetical protein [Lentisphaerota bacterium]